MSGQKILKEDPSYSEDISEEDIEAYAQQLGINISEEQHLLWIAKEGIQAPLPVSWCPVEDEKGNIYYYNQETDVSTWEHPADSHFRELVKSEREKHKSKSLGTETSDPGIDSKLSSLADAPPLTSGGKTSLSLSRDGRNAKAEQTATNSKSATKEGSRLSLSSALDYLPEDTGKSKSSPILKSSIAEGRKAPFSQRSVRFDLEDNSDEATHYSYEETDYDEEMPEIGGDLPGFLSDKHLLMDASQLSPILSSAGSPEPAAVNSLVKLGAQRLENNLQPTSKHLLQSLKQDETSKKTSSEKSLPSTFKVFPASSRERNENNSILKDSQETNEASHSSSKGILPLSPIKQRDSSELHIEEEKKKQEEPFVAEKVSSTEEYWDKKFSDVKEEHKKLFEDKKEALLKGLEEELSKQSKEKLKEMEEQLAKDMENEKVAMEITLNQMKQTNAETLRNERQKMSAELQDSVHALQEEMEQKKKKDLEELKSKLEEEHKQELEKMQNKLKEEHQESLNKLEAQLKEQNIKDLKQKEVESLAAQEKELKALEEKMSQMLKEKQDAFQHQINSLQAENDRNIQQESETVNNKEKILKDLDAVHLELKHLKELARNETEAVEILKNQKASLEQERMEITEQVEQQNNKMEEHRKGLLKLQEEKYSLQQDFLRYQKEVRNIQHYLEHLKKKSESTELSSSKQEANVVVSGYAENQKLHAEMSEHEKNNESISSERHVVSSSVGETVNCPSQPDATKESDKSQKDIMQPSVNDYLPEEHECVNDGSDVDHLKIRVDSLENCMRLLESRLEKKIHLDSIRNAKGNGDFNSASIHYGSSLLNDKDPALPNGSLRMGVSDKAIFQTTFPKDAFVAPLYSRNHIISASGDTSTLSCICDNGEACLLLHSLGQSLRTLHHHLHFPSWTLSVSDDHSTELPTSALRTQLHNFRHKLREHRDNHQRSELKFKLTSKEFCPPSATGGSSEAATGTNLHANSFHSGNSKVKKVFSADSSAGFSNWSDKIPPSFDADLIRRAQQLLRREQGTQWHQDGVQRTSFTFHQNNNQSNQGYPELLHNNKDGIQEASNGRSSLYRRLDAWPSFGPYGESSPTSISSVRDTEYAYFYGSKFPTPTPLPYTVEKVKADHDQWMARIDSIHQRIRNHERMSYVSHALLQTTSN